MCDYRFPDNRHYVDYIGNKLEVGLVIAKRAGAESESNRSSDKR